MKNRFVCLGLFVWLGLSTALSVQAAEIEIVVSAGKADRKNEPVCVALEVPLPGTEANKVVDPLGSGLAKTVELKQGGTVLIGQWMPAGLVTASGARGLKNARSELHFIVPTLKAGEQLVLKADLDQGKNALLFPARFSFTLGRDFISGLDFSTKTLSEHRPILQYKYKPLDTTSPANREQTYKVFHHLFDPSGKKVLSKGPGGQFTHHRGIFYGFSKVTYGEGKAVDIWHCKDDTYQGHEKFLEAEAGPVLGRQRVQIGWFGKGKELFAREERELSVYNVPGGTLIEFASKLTSLLGTTKLDGDPQHAGFHFRADNEVSEKTSKQTYYLRPDGIDKPGATRNWPAQKEHINLPWNAMSFVLGEKRYTVAYLDKPTNPKEARFSERDYGRFGSYFVAEVKPEKPLTVNYRLWLQNEVPTLEAIAAQSTAFVQPAEAKLK